MYARLGEIVSLDGSIAVTLAAHQAIGLKVKYLGMLFVTPEDLQESELCLLSQGLGGGPSLHLHPHPAVPHLCIPTLSSAG